MKFEITIKRSIIIISIIIIPSVIISQNPWMLLLFILIPFFLFYNNTKEKLNSRFKTLFETPYKEEIMNLIKKISKKNSIQIRNETGAFNFRENNVLFKIRNAFIILDFLSDYLSLALSKYLNVKNKAWETKVLMILTGALIIVNYLLSWIYFMIKTNFLFAFLILINTILIYLLSYFFQIGRIWFTIYLSIKQFKNFKNQWNLLQDTIVLRMVQDKINEVTIPIVKKIGTLIQIGKLNNFLIKSVELFSILFIPYLFNMGNVINLLIFQENTIFSPLSITLSIPIFIIILLLSLLHDYIQIKSSSQYNLVNDRLNEIIDYLMELNGLTLKYLGFEPFEG